MQSVDSSTLLAVELIKIFPNCLVILILIGIGGTLFFRKKYRTRLNELFDRLSHVGAFGVEVEFGEAKAQLQSAILSYKKDPFGTLPQDVAVDESRLYWLLNRAERMKDLLQGSRILWVDDQPLANAAIFRFLNDYGVVVDLAHSTKEAISALTWSANAYEVVVSDMVRGNDSQAGLELLDEIQKLNVSKKPEDLIEVLMFVYKLDSDIPPKPAKLITNKVDRLIEEIFVVIEKQHLQKPRDKK